jgi:hypothetical protein
MRAKLVRLTLTMTEARCLLSVLKSGEPGWRLENLIDNVHDSIEIARRASETVAERQKREGA